MFISLKNLKMWENTQKKEVLKVSDEPKSL